MPGQVTVEKVIERNAGVTLQEVQALLKQHHTEIFQQVQAAFQEERASTLPEVNTMLQKQYVCIKKDVEAKFNQERLKMQELRSMVNQEVQGKLQQDRLMILPEVQAMVKQSTVPIMQQARGPIIEEVQGMLQSERAYMFKSMKDLMQQQLSTVADNTTAEFKRIVTMINGVSTTSMETIERLENNYKSTLQDLNQITAGALADDLARLESDMKQNHSSLAADVKQTHSALESRVCILDTKHQELHGLTRELTGKVSEVGTKVNEANDKNMKHDDLHEEHLVNHQNLRRTLSQELTEQQQAAWAQLSASQKECTIEVAEIVQAQLDEALTASIEKLEKARVLDFQELTQLVKGEGQARGDLEQTLEQSKDQQGAETRKLKDRLGALEKFSEEFSLEVQHWMCDVKAERKSPDGRGKRSGVEPQSLDRYREILSLREFRNN